MLRSCLEADLVAKQQEVNQLTGQLVSSRAEIGRLEKDVEAKRLEIQRLATALKFMKIDQRLARITVLVPERFRQNGRLVYPVQLRGGQW